ncbi:hypothetical protein [Caballeronia pedi]|uniref:hypothetical protein n=1 Tax=Caballeronia pedi TaxID=1777141 RepID=UPI0011788C55|nr:hypothetical protein [Caballeronia pedi]
MRITRIDSTHLMGASEIVDVQNIKDVKQRKFSLGRTAALGAGGAAIGFAALAAFPVAVAYFALIGVL